MKLGPFSINWLREEKTIQMYLHTHFGKCQEISYTDDKWLDKFKHVMILLDKDVKKDKILGVEVIISY